MRLRRRINSTPHPILPLGGNVINLRGKPFWKRFFPLNPRHRGSLFPKIIKSFGKMAWKKPFFKRVSSKISARMLNFRMLNLMTLPLGGEQRVSVAGWVRAIT
jgi:hypothetical protein